MKVSYNKRFPRGLAPIGKRVMATDGLVKFVVESFRECLLFSGEEGFVLCRDCPSKGMVMLPKRGTLKGSVRSEEAGFCPPLPFSHYKWKVIGDEDTKA
jgi:hypothetical protein